MKDAQKIFTTTATADYKTPGLVLDQIYGIGAQVFYTGTFSGTLTLEVSNIDQPNSPPNTPSTNDNDWTTYTGSSTAISVAGSSFYNFNGLFSKYVRVKYAFTSGSAVLKVAYYGKGA